MGWVAREAHEAKEAVVEGWIWTKQHTWRKTFRSIFSLKHWGLKLGLIVFIAASITLSLLHNKIVTSFTPHKAYITSTPATWLAPIGLLILVSFPPLFGHEIIILVVGLIWGLGWGFGIAAAGTFIGEMIVFYCFKYFFIEKAKKIEDEQLMYGALARLMREGGLGMLVLVRYSILPGHVVTAIQSAIGTNPILYGLAILISMPKQFAIVYLGVIFGETVGPNHSASSVKKHRYVSLSIFGITALVSLFALFFIWTRARGYYKVILAEKAMREQDGGPALDSRGNLQRRGTENSTGRGIGGREEERWGGYTTPRGQTFQMTTGPGGAGRNSRKSEEMTFNEEEEYTGYEGGKGDYGREFKPEEKFSNNQRHPNFPAPDFPSRQSYPTPTPYHDPYNSNPYQRSHPVQNPFDDTPNSHLSNSYEQTPRLSPQLPPIRQNTTLTTSFTRDGMSSESENEPKGGSGYRRSPA